MLGKNKFRHIDLFSGIGGFALACKWTWGDQYGNVGHSEIEEYPCKVYHRHFPESECLGDITKIEWKEGQADLITGGFPCQPHSVAGKRKGSGDERDLWGECVRALRGIRPRYALFENVPGIFRSDNGRFFNRVLTDIHESGYDAEWQVISASSVGAIHKRERLWVLAYPNEVRCNGWEYNQGGVFQGAIAQDSIEPRDRGTSKTIGNASIGAHTNNGQERIQGIIEEEVSGEQRFPWGKVLRSIEEIRERSDIPQPLIRRVDDGIPNYVDRIAGLGNAIVPQVARVILEAIKQHEAKSFLQVTDYL